MKIRMSATDTAEIMLYDVIGEGFFGGITAKQFREQIKAVKAKKINLRINSPGGSVTEGAAMLAALDEFKGRIEVDIDGIAASAASVVAMAGDHIRMATNGLLMIHDPMAAVDGPATEHRRMADLLDKVRGQIVDAYSRKSKVGRPQIEKWMADETWFTGPEAVAAGLVHEATPPMEMAAFAGGRALIGKLGYKHRPALLTAQMVDNPMAFAVGECVQWLIEEPDELSAELEDGMIEEISTGKVLIPGTSLVLAGSVDDPAVRVCDQDEDETCWYLVRASQLRKMGDMDAADEPTITPAMPMMGAEWDETRKRKDRLASLMEKGDAATPASPF